MPLKTITGTMAASGWKDRLVSWDGKAITYDGCGNMLIRGSRTYGWAEGRKLTDVTAGGHTIHYDYGYNDIYDEETGMYYLQSRYYDPEGGLSVRMIVTMLEQDL